MRRPSEFPCMASWWRHTYGDNDLINRGSGNVYMLPEGTEPA